MTPGEAHHDPGVRYYNSVAIRALALAALEPTLRRFSFCLLSAGVCSVGAPLRLSGSQVEREPSASGISGLGNRDQALSEGRGSYEEMWGFYG